MEMITTYVIPGLYLALLIFVCLRVIVDTQETPKTLAYLLVIIFLPVIGILIYFIFGVNYRKRKIYSKKLSREQELAEQIEKEIQDYTFRNIEKYRDILQESETTVRYLLNDTSSPLTEGNDVELLFNGDNKFERLKEELKKAHHHIHIEYYIIEEGRLISDLRDILVQKAYEGVKVRIIYDDFGSGGLSNGFINELESNGIEVFPFHRVWLILFANRLNYRNHRKIVVIDGQVGFTGGVNISDRYINEFNGEKYWRDTHLMIRGNGVFKLQYLFFTSWRFCSGEELPVNQNYFPPEVPTTNNSLVQIASGGPDSPRSTILLTIMDAVSAARERLYITTPYFIPDESLRKIIEFEALAGLDVRLLVPGRPESFLINAAACSFYSRLLEAGVRIFLYEKGVIHSKTIIADNYLSIVGTANMDQRSFDLNFEVNAMVYDRNINAELTSHFLHDLEQSREIDPVAFANRPQYKQYGEGVARLLSPLM